MIKNKILKFLLLILIFISKIEINSAVELGDYDSDALNASIITYGKSQDGETYVLLAHELARAAWTTSGGARDPSHGTILDTAVSELYEETAAFPLFNPIQIKSLLKRQDATCVFRTATTDIFALNIGNYIDQCRDIGVNYQQRIVGRPHCFGEMNQWKLVNAKDLYTALNAHTHPVNHNLNIPTIGPMMRYVFNGLWNFYQTGLRNVIDTSINNSNIITISTPIPAVPVITPTPVLAVPVITPTPVPAVPATTLTPIPAVPVITPTPVPAVPVITPTTAPLQSLRFGNLFKGLDASKLSPPLIVTKKSIITPKIVSIPTPLVHQSSRFNNLFKGLNVSKLSPPSIVTKRSIIMPKIVSIPTPLVHQSSRFNNLFNSKFGAAKISTSAITPLRSKSSGFNNFKKFGLVKISAPVIVYNKSINGLLSSFGKLQKLTKIKQGIKTNQSRNFLNLSGQ